MPSDPVRLPDESQHMIGVRCNKCGHVTYFDKRTLCNEKHTIYRGDEDELNPPCGNCYELLKVRIDCREYR